MPLILLYFPVVFYAIVNNLLPDFDDLT